jgi:hypothetical protein
MSTVDRFRSVLKLGLTGTGELQAQAQIVELFSRYFDDKFVLLRNLVLPDLDVPIPLILVSPAGVLLLYVTPLKGIYRARSDSWSVVDSRRHFKPARPNLLNRTSLMARAVHVYLERQGMPGIDVDPVLLCTDPGIHVETIRPSVRVVMTDAMDRFIAGLQQAQITLTGPEVEIIVERLTSRPAPDRIPASTPESAALEHPGASGLSEEPLPPSMRGELHSGNGGVDRLGADGTNAGGHDAALPNMADPSDGDPGQTVEGIDLLSRLETASPDTPDVPAPGKTGPRRPTRRPSLAKRLHLNRQQVFILATLAALNVCVLVAFLLVILFTT